TIRVQPHLPSKPFTATVIESSGAARCACSAANKPAPPAPRIRRSVSSVRTVAPQPLHVDHDCYQREADRVEHRLRIHEQEACDDQHYSLDGVRALEEPPLQAAGERCN